MKKPRVYITLIFLLNWINYTGQTIKKAPNNLKFKHFSSKDGLSQSSVIEIFQDKKGYLWFGTRDGLNKFDGNKFTVYRHNSKDLRSLTHSTVTSIYEDHYGNLWIGTIDGLNKYNARLDNFTQYKYSEDKPSISDNEIWEITQIDSSSLWIATNNGISKLNIKNDKFNHYKKDKKNINSLSDNRTRGLLEARNGNLWVNTVKSIDLFDPINNSFKHYNYPKGNGKESHLNNGAILFNDSKDRIWLGNEQGLAFFNTKDQTFIQYIYNEKPAITSSIRSICEDYFGNLWIGTYTGLYILNHEKQTLNNFMHDENDPKSLSQNSIYEIKQDSKGDIWIGTWSGGINYYDRSFDNFKQLRAGTNNKMLNYKVVSAIVEDSNQNLWIGTEGGGINIFNRNTKQISYLTHDTNNPNSLSSNNVKSLIKDSAGNFWVGTHGNGINFLNPKVKPYKFYHFENSASNEIDIKEHIILSIFEDINKNIWIGTSTQGLVLYNHESDSFSKLDESYKSINCIVQSKNPNILLIGGNNGFEKVNINTRQTIKINYNNQQNKSSISKSVNCIYEDEDENYWIGTEGQGLVFYNQSNKSTTNYGISQGLPNEVIYSILPDKNNLWISTNQGLSKLNLDTEKIVNFDVSDGLQSNEFNYGASLKTDSGEIMFGGANGLNYFHPNKIIENTFIPPIDIHTLKISNKPFLKITDSISKVVLKYNQNDFSLDFTALGFSQSNKNKYAYKLEGFDPDWNYIGNKKTATYTNLDQGDYVFRVKASNNNDLWNEKGASLNISIKPAPWKTWWAYLIYLFIIGSILNYIKNLIQARIVAKNELIQEKIDKEKLEEINQLKLRFFTNISHDFRTPLTLIIGPIEMLLKAKITEDFVKKNLEVVHRNTNNLLQLINELLDFRKIESEKLQLYTTKTNIAFFIREIKLSFEKLAESRGIQYNLKYDEENLEVWFDKAKLKKILFNLLSNAFKFTPNNSEISINLSTSKSNNNDNGFVKIVVSNFGKTIPKEQIDFIFDRFHQIDPNDSQTGTGIGLSLTKKLVELHKGTIKVESTKQKGTNFTVYLPLGDNHLSENQKNNDSNLNKETVDIFYQKSSYYAQKELSLIDNELVKKDPINTSLSTILVVDDNVELREFVKNIFKEKYNIFEAENGKTAIEIAKKEDITLIISDVMMPIMNGFELSEKIKTNIITSHIPIILLTAKNSETHKEQGYRIGADAYITKPFDADVLEIRVHNIIQFRENIIKKFKKDKILKPKELTNSSADELFLQKAFNLVEENLSNSDFTIQFFISKMNMSRSVLYRKLKALTNQSITEFIRTIKIKRAAQLIINTNLSISEIALDLGFNDLKHFRNSFKKLFNELPSQYRIKNSGNLIENFDEIYEKKSK